MTIATQTCPLCCVPLGLLSTCTCCLKKEHIRRHYNCWPTAGFVHFPLPTVLSVEEIHNTWIGFYLLSSCRSCQRKKWLIPETSKKIYSASWGLFGKFQYTERERCRGLESSFLICFVSLWMHSLSPHFKARGKPNLGTHFRRKHMRKMKTNILHWVHVPSLSQERGFTLSFPPLPDTGTTINSFFLCIWSGGQRLFLEGWGEVISSVSDLPPFLCHDLNIRLKAHLWPDPFQGLYPPLPTHSPPVTPSQCCSL